MSIYERSTTPTQGPLAEQPKDPFKPARSEIFLAFISPHTIVYRYWKRAGLTTTLVHSFYNLSLLTTALYSVLVAPSMVLWCWKYETGMEDTDPFFAMLSRGHWFWRVEAWVRHAWMVPYLVMVAIAARVWQRATAVSHHTAQGVRGPPSGDTLMNTSQARKQSSKQPSLLSLIHFLQQPPDLAQIDTEHTADLPTLDDFDRKWLDSEVAYLAPALLFLNFGPTEPRFIFLMLSLLQSVCYYLPVFLLSILLAYPVLILYMRTTGGMNESVQAVFMLAVWGASKCAVFLMTISGVLWFLAWNAYEHYKRAGSRLQAPR